ncbi:MAG TPA: hypothetical protein VFE79_26070 [Paraburkholderia sp.]|nr:hypothetical protein [Paraburkholderia sp.]
MTEVTGPEFVRRLERQWRRRTAGARFADGVPDVPTGPEDAVGGTYQDSVLVVTDSVDLRGRVMSASTFVYGVLFRGRVDMRDVTVKGSLDLSACVFEEGISLNDAQIEGTLRLAGISAPSVGLVSIVVQGRLDLRGSKTFGQIKMYGAQIDGFVDLRGVSATEVLMRGAMIGSDLRIGCAPGQTKAPGNIGLIDASNAAIKGTVSVLGAGDSQRVATDKLPSPEDGEAALQAFLTSCRWSGKTQYSGTASRELSLILSGARISGSLRIGPQFDGVSGVERADRYPSTTAGNPIAWPILNDVQLVGAKVDGDIKVEGARIESDGVALSLNNATVLGNVWIQTGTVGLAPDPDDPSPTKKYIYASREVVIGNANDGSANAVDIAGAEIRGNLVFEGAEVRGAINGSGLTVRGYAWLRCTADQGASFPFYKGMDVRGDIDFSTSEFGQGVYFGGVSIRGDVKLYSVKTEGVVSLDVHRHRRTEIAGELNLRAANAAYIYCKGIRVGSSVDLSMCRAVRLRFVPARLSRLDRPALDIDEKSLKCDDEAIVFTEVGAFFMRNAVILGDVTLSHLQVRSVGHFEGRRGLFLEESSIGGELSFFRIGAVRDIYAPFQNVKGKAKGLECELPISLAHHSAAICGDMRVRRCEVKGDSDFSFIKVDGEIDLEDSRFMGDLKFCSTLTHDAPDSDDDLIREIRQLPPMALPFRATCRRMVLRMVKCMNDVDLTGLHTYGHTPSGASGEGTVAIAAQYVEVVGDLVTFFESRDPANKACAWVVLCGALDLSYSKIAHLVVWGKSFLQVDNPRSGSNDRHEGGLILERATVGNLDIPDTLEAARPSYPVPVNFTDIAVSVWSIGERNRQNRGANRFINLLREDRPFRRSTYRSVERSLRDGGQDDHADTVYHAMKNREWREDRKSLTQAWQKTRERARACGLAHWWKNQRALVWKPAGTGILFALNSVRHKAYWYLLRFGTNPMPLFILVLALFLLMLPIYLTRENFETSLPFLATHTSRFDNVADAKRYHAHPDENSWRWSDALEIAVHNHIPVVPLSARSEWEARDEGASEWRAFGLKAALPIAPEDLFNLVQLVNWICWPVILTWLVRRLIRDN